jgi:uncharacterized protein YceK
MGSGCSSVRGRDDSRFYPGVCPGLQHHTADYTSHSEGEEPVFFGNDGETKESERRLAAVIDFPFTLALDTALLPWDVLYSALKKDAK